MWSRRENHNRVVPALSYCPSSSNKWRRKDTLNRAHCRAHVNNPNLPLITPETRSLRSIAAVDKREADRNNPALSPEVEEEEQI
ncbi:hypothetical protein J4Q44_G00153270 [Coregonus suidteri]|uniref:Uncharacterized protein n=1 Tax=Coregonus suidteri TaxID=861788 RepID=A0AAN8LNQ8_9TELE